MVFCVRDRPAPQTIRLTMHDVSSEPVGALMWPHFDPPCQIFCGEFAERFCGEATFFLRPNTVEVRVHPDVVAGCLPATAGAVVAEWGTE